MEIGKGQIFNLWNTNGRRHDVLNALKIYLEILQEIQQEYPRERWNRYPESIAEFLFYQKAVDASPEVFKKHSKYDRFIENLDQDYASFLTKNPDWFHKRLDQKSWDLLDEAIEARARHYTSNLVKIGFADERRNISTVGASYLKKRVERDPIESILPFDDINLILLRQMLKLRIFSKPDENGRRSFYSPFFMAMLLLLSQGPVDKNRFLTIVQGLDPYLEEGKRAEILENPAEISHIEQIVWTAELPVEEELLTDEELSDDLFKKYMKNRKSGKTDAVYYGFYRCLCQFRGCKTEENFRRLMHLLSDNREKLQKAFGYGRGIFDTGRNGEDSLEEFLKKNAEHPFLAPAHFNWEFYKAFCGSSRVDDIKEYSDTTERILGATGLFKLESLPELAYKEAVSLIFDQKDMKSRVFGSLSEEEYQAYEGNIDSIYRQNLSISAILNYGEERMYAISERIGYVLGVKGLSAIQAKLRSKTSGDFARHVETKYPKEKIMELLPLFSDRRNDAKIKKEVNDTATVPTIYEYIVGIAWYYLSGKDFDLYSSLNLTLNADFEPVIHAGGGDGDIVIQYDESIVMLEVTLMNKQAQKRGEWEPVLRHSLNLKAAHQPKQTLTFFIADVLDYNTMNIWRAVAAVPLESTNKHERVEGVVIMPFTNGEILRFLENNISHTKIIEEVKDSFRKVPQITDTQWHEEVIHNLVR